jgi:hypothetical protein
MADPRVLAPVLGLIGIPLLSTQLQGIFGPDVSWKLGVSLAMAQGQHYGSDIVFTYGPLSFLSVPNDVFLLGAVLGVLFLFLSSTALYYFFIRWLAQLVPPWAVIAISVACMLIWSGLWGESPEIVVAATTLGALWVIHPERRAAQLTEWVAPTLAAVAALQLLVKFSSGLICLAVALVVGLLGDGRLRRMAATVGTFVAVLLLLWMISGQLIGQLPHWLARSTQVAVGYSDAMALPLSGGNAGSIIVLLLAVLGVLVLGGALMVRRWGRACLPSLVVLGGVAWYFVKQGVVRYDAFHTSMTFVGLSVLVVTLPWTGRRLAFGLTAVAASLAGIVLVVFAPSSLIHGLGDVMSGWGPQRSDATETAGAVAHEVVSPSFHTERVARTRQFVQLLTGVPPAVRQALVGTKVQADPWDISAVWANGLVWRPAPVFQTYSAYTPDLDDLNARSLVDTSDVGVLRLEDKGLDGRDPTWESPRYEMTLNCSFFVAAQVSKWQALRRAPTSCGHPHFLGEVQAKPGQAVAVPRASGPDRLVVATMTMPEPLLDRLAALAFRPLRMDHVATDGVPRRLVTGTMGQPHLLRIPDEVNGRRPPSGGLDVDSLRFSDVPGPVTVRFYEVPIQPNR